MGTSGSKYLICGYVDPVGNIAEHPPEDFEVGLEKQDPEVLNIPSLKVTRQLYV